jgi:hypothetical protein
MIRRAAMARISPPTARAPGRTELVSASAPAGLHIKQAGSVGQGRRLRGLAAICLSGRVGAERKGARSPSMIIPKNTRDARPGRLRVPAPHRRHACRHPARKIHMMDKGALAFPGIRVLRAARRGGTGGDGGLQADRRDPCRDQVDACAGRGAGKGLSKAMLDHLLGSGEGWTGSPAEPGDRGAVDLRGRAGSSMRGRVRGMPAVRRLPGRPALGLHDEGACLIPSAGPKGP